jgi:hypothetical protein
VLGHLGRFHCYLYGKKFTLRTDHEALKYLQFLRWSLRLSEFDFTVEHLQGTQIRHVDALSRAVKSVAHGQDLPRENVKVEQETDKYCRLLELGNQNRKSEYFANEEGVIYRRRKNS